MLRQWHIHTLLNCVLREVDLKSKDLRAAPGEAHSWLSLSFKKTDSQFLFKLRNSQSLMGNVEYLGESYFKSSEPEGASAGWEKLDPEKFADLIYKELSQTYTQLREPDFIQNVKNSLKVGEVFAEVIKEADFLLLKKSNLFLSSEQSLVYGHPFHPSPKSRLGFTDQDIKEYSPELGRGFRLRYWEVARELIVEDSVLQKKAYELLPGFESHFQKERIPIPLHPWEARYLAQVPEVQKAIRDGTVADLGEQGVEFFPTASVRTLYNPNYEYFLKMSLHVRITNCIRRNSLSELRSALEVSKLLKRIPETFFKEHKLNCLQEPAYLTLKLGKESETEGFGMLFREKPWDLSQCVVAGALFGNHLRGRKWALGFLEESGLDLLSWWGRYLEVLMVPSIKMFLDYGLMSEPHLQNVLVRLDHGTPVGIYIRDLDNYRVVQGSWARSLLQDSQLIGDLVFGAEEAFDRFVYCLMVNHLNEVVFTFADGQVEVEKQMWSVLRKRIERLMEERSEKSASVQVLSFLLAKEGLPTKANLITRFRRCEDRKAMYFDLPNPLRLK